MTYLLTRPPLLTLLLAGFLGLLPAPASAQTEPTAWQLTVNSNADTLDPEDGQVTFREALSFFNGDRPLAQFSSRERLQIVANPQGLSRIQFQLPPNQTTIFLSQVLPEVQAPGLVIDGSNHMQRQVDETGTETLAPLIALTPAPEAVVPQGLTLVADGIQVKALSIYGFNQPHTATAGSIVANVVVAHPGAPPRASQGRATPDILPFRDRDRAPQDIQLLDNWIGQAPNPDTTAPRSAHGIYVLNAENLTIQDNVISDHQGAGIVTGFRAEGTVIARNVLEANGTAGLPDAIRLEGQVDRTTIQENLIYRSGGSGLYLFKPKGSVTVANNVFSDNGQRYRRAAIYVTGSHHTLTENWIGNQGGPGIVVAAVPRSRGVQIQRNQFVNLQGLSIDLVTQAATGVQDYQQGDGRNPPLQHHQRRRISANYGVNTPQFAHSTLIQLPSGMVTVLGRAEPGSELEIYRADATGTLLEALHTTPVNDQGMFAITLADLVIGDQISAIATHPEYGTSEPAVVAEIRGLE